MLLNFFFLKNPPTPHSGDTAFAVGFGVCSLRLQPPGSLGSRLPVWGGGLGGGRVPRPMTSQPFAAWGAGAKLRGWCARLEGRQCVPGPVQQARGRWRAAAQDPAAGSSQYGISAADLGSVIFQPPAPRCAACSQVRGWWDGKKQYEPRTTANLWTDPPSPSRCVFAPALPPLRRWGH